MKQPSPLPSPPPPPLTRSFPYQPFFRMKQIVHKSSYHAIRLVRFELLIVYNRMPSMHCYFHHHTFLPVL